MTPMEPPTVSIVIPAFNEEADITITLETIGKFLESTGLSHEIVVVDDGSTDGTAARVTAFAAGKASVRLISTGRNAGKGAAVRRGVLDARGHCIAFIDADLPYSTANLGEAIALVQSGATDLAIGARDLRESGTDRSYPLFRRIAGRSFSVVVRNLLVPDIPDTQCGLKAFSSSAAKVLFGESRLDGFGFDFEIVYLARKYGFRIERIPVTMTHRHASKVRLIRDSAAMLRDVWRVRRYDAQLAYRSARRCPVCFSSEVGTRTQIRGWVVRDCQRCKCRYLDSLPREEDAAALYDAGYFESDCDLERGYSARSSETDDLTSRKRVTLLRRLLPSGARILEVGSGRGSFGRFAAAEFDYVGIDVSSAAVKQARAGGLEVYCSTLGGFVNTGAPFDAVVMFHVFEHLPDPHDALWKLRELLRPGGVLLLVTPDTESLLATVSSDRWVSYKFPEHLILYSRSAMIELLDSSGFEIVSLTSDFEYCDGPFLASRIEQIHPVLGRVASGVLRVMPERIPVSSGSLRVAARRRSGPPVELRPIRAAEPTHAR
jgi:dolichyl-phosphate beta-glucosyltransferase